MQKQNYVRQSSGAKAIALDNRLQLMKYRLLLLLTLIVGGATGTLNEFTIAYDERKVVGVLEGTGGAADQIKNIEAISSRREGSALLFESSPEALIDNCLRMLGERD